MTKKATVIMATFTPYRPFLPARKIAMVLGDSTSAKNINPAPAIRTHKDKSLSPSKARLMEPRNTTENIPAAPSMMLQKLGDFIEAKIISE